MMKTLKGRVICLKKLLFAFMNACVILLNRYTWFGCLRTI